MREFIGFSDSVHACPLAEQTVACQPSSEAHAHGSSSRDLLRPGGQRPWRCPSTSWKLRLDDASLPWWNWTKLTKFWVDGQWFHGPIPGKLIASSWPELRTLDFYDNRLSGPVPAEVLTMPLLGYIQLHGNNLSGLPTAADLGDRAAPLVELKLQHNPGLEGCVPPTFSSFSANRPGYQGAVVPCGRGGESESERAADKQSAGEL